MSGLKAEILRYANCWEDAEILIKGLQPSPGSRILSIGSAGDNTFSLLTTHPSEMVAVDINPIQLYLVEFKAKAIQLLEREQTLAFLGFKQDSQRWEKYQLIRPHLSKAAAQHWDGKKGDIVSGIIYSGKFEKYFKKFCDWILPLIHSHQTIQALFEVKSEAEQIHFYQTQWNTWRWRLLFKIYFSRFVMSFLGRDPAFLKEVNIDVGESIFLKAEKQLSSTRAFQNFILRFNLTASFDDLLPHYLQPLHYENARKNISNLRTHHGFITDLTLDSNYFNYMNLSNIFEYMNPSEFHLNVQHIHKMLVPEGKIAYWNLMVPRRISQLEPNWFRHSHSLSQALTEMDQGFFYDQFLIDIKNH
jgi:S-adenosylmethionine-diacylglycerol 3-amino-3-carboxypropyl transferase